jgi:hypothetical protein
VLFRRAEIWDAEKQEAIVFLSNLLALGATTIAAIYKDRWQVELSFKALKQTLKIKAFVGTSASARRHWIGHRWAPHNPNNVCSLSLLNQAERVHLANRGAARRAVRSGR